MFTCLSSGIRPLSSINIPGERKRLPHRCSFSILGLGSVFLGLPLQRDGFFHQTKKKSHALATAGNCEGNCEGTKTSQAAAAKQQVKQRHEEKVLGARARQAIWLWVKNGTLASGNIDQNPGGFILTHIQHHGFARGRIGHRGKADQLHKPGLSDSFLRSWQLLSRSFQNTIRLGTPSLFWGEIQQTRVTILLKRNSFVR